MYLNYDNSLIHLFLVYKTQEDFCHKNVVQLHPILQSYIAMGTIIWYAFLQCFTQASYLRLTSFVYSSICRV